MVGSGSSKPSIFVRIEARVQNIANMCLENKETICINLRKAGFTYGDIQKRLGNPSKKWIRQTLLKYAPELINNSVSKQNKFTSSYSEIYNILVHTDKMLWNIFGEEVELYIKDKQVYYDGDLLSIWSEVEQSQILEEIKKQL